jgi:uncharacterized phage protein (TIGR02218 family)
MKTLPSALETHYGLDATTLAVLLKITRRDGEVFGFTSHDKPLIYSGLTYFTGPAAPTLSDLKRETGLAPSNAEVDGAFNDDITVDDTEAELWSGAVVDVYRANWRDLTNGVELMAHGELGEITHDGRKYKVEMMGRAHKFGRVVTRHYLPTCDADLGDTRCGVDIEALAVNLTVTAVTSNRQFTTDLGSPATADYFTYGRVTWLTGLNINREMEVKDQSESGVFTLQLGMKREIQVGDTLRAYPGCNKLLKTGVAEYLGDCKIKFDNVVNFRGFPEIPGIDKILKPAGI